MLWDYSLHCRKCLCTLLDVQIRTWPWALCLHSTQNVVCWGWGHWGGQTELKSLLCKKSRPVVVFKSCRSCGAGSRSWMCLGEPCACGGKVWGKNKLASSHPVCHLWSLRCWRDTDLAEVPKVQTVFAINFDELLVSDGSFKQLWTLSAFCSCSFYAIDKLIY